MDQSKSSSSEIAQAGVQLPKRGITIEFMVGLFTMASVAAAGYLAVGLGDLEFGGADKYIVYAEFDNISGLKKGASVEIGGVQIGEVTDLKLKDPVARITLRLDRGVQLRDDDIASIRTKGIIGDRYVKISRGASDNFIPEGGTLVQTESVVDIEDIIGKVVHSLGGDKDEDEKGKDKDKKDK